MCPKVPDSGGFQSTPLERWPEAKPLADSGLQRFMDFHGIPWIDAVERVKRTAPAL
jgi:hypothetical protein